MTAQLRPLDLLAASQGCRKRGRKALRKKGGFLLRHGLRAVRREITIAAFFTAHHEVAARTEQESGAGGIALHDGDDRQGAGQRQEMGLTQQQRGSAVVRIGCEDIGAALQKDHPGVGFLRDDAEGFAQSGEDSLGIGFGERKGNVNAIDAAAVVENFDGIGIGRHRNRGARLIGMGKRRKTAHSHG